MAIAGRFPGRNRRTLSGPSVPASAMAGCRGAGVRICRMLHDLAYRAQTGGRRHVRAVSDPPSRSSELASKIQVKGRCCYWPSLGDAV